MSILCIENYYILFIWEYLYDYLAKASLIPSDQIHAENNTFHFIYKVYYITGQLILASTKHNAIVPIMQLIFCLWTIIQVTWVQREI
jgi:hypothetical protein